MENARALGSVAPPESGRKPASSDAGTSTCSGCRREIDPLRAGHVAILDERFFYFCDAKCKAAYFEITGRAPPDGVLTQRPPPVWREADAEPSAAHDSGTAPAAMQEGAPAESPPDEGPRSDPTVEAAPITLPSPGARSAPAADAFAIAVPSKMRSEAVAALDMAGIVIGALVPALGLLGSEADAVRAPLVGATWLTLALHVALVERDPADPHPLVVLVPATGAAVAACWATAIHDPRAGALTIFAALACAVALLVEVLVERARSRVHEARRQIEQALDLRVRAVHGGDRIDRPASEIRPGEQIVVEPGEMVGVDATVTAGEARVVPWLGAQVELVRREGDPVLAGARVVSSPLRMTTTWSGRDRAWVRLLSSRATRIDVASPTAKAVRHVVERGAPLAAVAMGVAAFAANAVPIELLAATCAGAIAFGAKAASSLVALHFSRAQLQALASGIAYKDARAFERAASANLAVLSARGTVLRGEPEVVAIEEAGAVSAERILALAAGAEMAATHRFAAAVLGAARMRGVRPDPVRNATARAGLGITAVASTGERLVVGGRNIMLEEKIGVAVTDARASELEAQGRSVLLVALGDRLAGLIALQDGLKPGARAAVQKLLDAHIEPVLLSGEARDTCETIGRALDIEHVRPEVLPADRGAEVRALAEGGSVVAVVGSPPADDGALAAADVAVAMGAAGSTMGDWGVVVASDDVRDAALALSIPHAARERARLSLVLGATPGIAALFAIGFGVAPFALAPIGALIGALAVAVQAREVVGESR